MLLSSECETNYKISRNQAYKVFKECCNPSNKMAPAFSEHSKRIFFLVKRMSKALSSVFTGDIDFCPDCGAILPLPGEGKTISCKLCSFSVNVEEFHGKELHTSITFNKRGDWASHEHINSSGPLVDRRCPKCGHEGMNYSTLQTRSVDEGQTVFYSCPKCKFQEQENS